MSKRKRVELSLQDKVKMIKSSETLPKPTIKVRFNLIKVLKALINRNVQNRSETKKNLCFFLKYGDFHKINCKLK